MQDDDREVDLDYRFTLANERTFLAWLRTALVLLAASVALVHLVPEEEVTDTQRAVALVAGLLGIASVVLGLRRWRVVETRMRRGAKLPESREPLLLGVGVAILGLLVVLLLVLS